MIRSSSIFRPSLWIIEQKALLKDEFKFVAPKSGQPHEKEANGKTHCYCDTPHGIEGTPMWTLHKPGDYKDSKPKKPKEEKLDLELQDDLSSLLSVHAKDFS